MAQEFKQPQRSESDDTPEPDADAPAVPGGAEAKEALDSEVDDLLDEIDDVLESNAEEFVKSFIQKGGQ